ncbi:MAG: RNA methyltransferase, partial [Bryobacterales bacterium]|nr:RNA methyltransferase [Bryobacterales bacterium]
VDAILIPDRRAAGITETVVKASAGAIEHIALVKIGNVRQEMAKLKEKGYWIYGLDERGEESYDQVAYNAPTVFVLGGEGKGLHEHVRKQCDAVVRIPMAGAIASLNVSVAAGVVLFEWRRRNVRS